MNRLLIVSNRLPVTVKLDGGDIQIIASAGGLATALKGPHERSDSLWIGWPGDLIWAHDYQLSLLPALVRKRFPQARIGFFLHIPFPSSEVFRILPWREEILEGMEDSIVEQTTVTIRNRTVRLGVFPIGIDVDHFESMAGSADVLVEEKDSALAWHYRMAEPEFAFIQLQRLIERIRRDHATLPVETLAGDKILEIRLKGVNKGLVVDRLPGATEGIPLLVAIGDDRTDEDLFARLPTDGIAIHVGLTPTRAPYRLPDVRADRHFLWQLAATGHESSPDKTHARSQP